MYFQIKEIVLWAKNPQFAPRRVTFKLGVVNVISGSSRTGKSAVIPIIDYCLGSGSCSIPVKTIRDACSWFGVIVTTTAGEKLFARREPGLLRNTDDMFILEARSIEQIPAVVSKNTNADNVRRLLDTLSGLTNLDFVSGEAASGFEGRPSFRDLAAFLFQPQNIIANPEVLFFKTNTYEHREKLRKVFPYILDAVTPALLAKQHEFARLQRELKRKDRELQDAKQVSERWNAELRAKVSEARELGILTVTESEPLTRGQMIEVLEELVKRTDVTLAVSSSTISEAIRELTALENEESQTSRELTSLRRRLAEMSRIRESANSYHEALRIQRDRLQIADWLAQHRSHDEECPLCGGGMEPAAEKLEQLQGSLRNLEDAAGGTTSIPAAFDREYQRVEAEVAVTSERLRSVQLRKNALSQRSQEARTRQYQAQKVERYIGNLENALQLHSRLGQDADLDSEVQTLRRRVGSLSAELRNENIKERQDRALRIVNMAAGRLLPFLDNERPNDPVSLQPDDLTIRVSSTNREDYLSEIGSGSNWLSYHVATLLALHQFFLGLKHSPVPGFIVLDQPSQVYFPKKLAARDSEEEVDPPLDDEDVEAVQKAYQVLGSVVRAAGGMLQAIVLDHAARDVWGGIPFVEEIEEWRDGHKLVPPEWLQE